MPPAFKMKPSRLSALLLGLSAVAALGTVALPAQAQTTLYNQPVIVSSRGGNAYTSENNTNPVDPGHIETAYDNFSLGTSSAIGGINWRGIYFVGGAAPIDSFALTFYSDAAGKPGAAIATENITGNAGETLVSISQGVTYESYSAAFTPSFTAVAGTQYWLSIVPTLFSAPLWAWSTGSGGDNRLFQDDVHGTRIQHGDDLAFGLTGPSASAAPEPAQWAGLSFAAFGLLAFGWNTRRKNKSAAQIG